jgi:hypothetical protein
MLFEVGSSVGCDPTSLTALEDLQVDGDWNHYDTSEQYAEIAGSLKGTGAS